MPLCTGTSLHLVAALAQDQGRSALRYRGAFPTEQLFWSLTESFRFVGDADALPRFVADAEGTFARGVSAEAPVDWRPRPTSGAFTRTGSSSSSGTASSASTGRAAPIIGSECQGLRRREHRVVRVVEGDAGPRYVASLAALGGIIEDHLSLDERAEVLERHSPGLDPPGVESVAGPWREALGALLPLEATPLLAGAIEAVWPGIALGWGPVPGDLVDASGPTLRVSPKLARAYRSRHGGPRGEGAADAGAATGARGPRIGRARRPRGRDGLAGGDAPARQEAELDAAAGRDRVALAQAALTPLGRLLDGLERGRGLPE